MVKLLAAVALAVQVCAAVSPGAYREYHEVDDTVREIAHFAIPRMQKSIKSDRFFTLKSVDKIHKQIVAGVNTRLEVTLAETDCPQDAGRRGLRCAVKPRHSTVTCRFVVYDVPWMGRRELTKHHCGSPTPAGATAPARARTPTAARQQRGQRRKGGRRGKLSGKKLHASFRSFVHKYNRKYATSAEYRRRLQIFAENMKHADNFQRMERGTARYGVTKFSDMTVEEFRASRLGLDLSRGRPEPDGRFRQPAAVPDVADLPKSFDWREQGAVTAVKDQGQCGSCWAFSVTGNVEGQYFLKHKKLLSFSEQELVDCDTDDHGCQGGLPDQAYKFIEFLGGLEQEEDYPYEARNGQCRLNRTDLVAKLTGSVDLPKNEADIQKWLYANGPVSIGVNANPLMFYRGGIIDVWSFLCRASGIDHGVLLVGFGEHDYPVVNKTKPFWIVKNSWGGDWGEQGYFRLFRGSDECGVQDMASSAVVA